MKHSIALLSLGLIISACQGPSKPAPYELKGTKFYGKNAGSNSEYIDDYQDSDVNKDFVYKGRSGSGSIDEPYQDEPDYSSPPNRVLRSSDYENNDAITKKPLDSGITSTKLAPPPKYVSEPETQTSSRLVDDHIDQYEDETLGKSARSSNIKVPTSRDKLTNYNDEPALKAKSSDYLDLKNVEDRAAKREADEISKPAQTATSYGGERADKLKDVFPKEKPHFNDEIGSAEIVETDNEIRKPSIDITAKDKPRHLELANNDIEPKERATLKEENAAEPEEKDKPAEKVEIKREPKPEPKVEAKKTAKQNEVALKAEDSGFISVPEKAPAAKAEVKKPEVKKAEVKKEEPRHEKLEIASTPEKTEPEVKKQDIASIPKVEPAATGGPAKFIKPVEGKIVQEFGQGNDGIRIQAPEGTAVKAAGSGEVVYSGNELQGYGNMIVIKHPNGFLTAYSHLDNLGIKKGEKVSQGEVIGLVGKTGNVQSPQLHFGVRKGRSAVNPRDYIN